MNFNGLVNYQSILNSLKDKIRSSRSQAVLRLNADLLTIYWEIGKAIFDQEKLEGWGAKIVDTLAKDLKAEFPE